MNSLSHTSDLPTAFNSSCLKRSWQLAQVITKSLWCQVFIRNDSLPDFHQGGAGNPFGSRAGHFVSVHSFGCLLSMNCPLGLHSIECDCVAAVTAPVNKERPLRADIQQIGGVYGPRQLPARKSVASLIARAIPARGSCASLVRAVMKNVLSVAAATNVKIAVIRHFIVCAVFSCVGDAVVCAKSGHRCGLSGVGFGVRVKSKHFRVLLDSGLGPFPPPHVNRYNRLFCTLQRLICKKTDKMQNKQDKTL